MRTLLSAALLFSLFLLVGCGGTSDSESMDGPDSSEEITEEEEAEETELNAESDSDDDESGE